MSLVEFRPGTAQFTDSGRQSLAKVAQALTDRPSLIMTVTGSADTASERDDVRRNQLEARLLASDEPVRALRALLAGPLPDISLYAQGQLHVGRLTRIAAVAEDTIALTLLGLAVVLLPVQRALAAFVAAQLEQDRKSVV